MQSTSKTLPVSAHITIFDGKRAIIDCGICRLTWRATTFRGCRKNIDKCLSAVSKKIIECDFKKSFKPKRKQFELN